MGKAPTRNALTGCIRRGVKRDHSAYRRALHLSIKEVGLRDLLQCAMLFSGVMAQITLHQLSPVAVLHYLALYLSWTILEGPGGDAFFLACKA
jgi:hypothetical protein